MNGYFNNLALRSMNAGNLVEPRLPSLFEPQRSEPDVATAVYSEPQPRSVDAPPTESPQLKVSLEQSTVVDDVVRPQAAVTTARPLKKSDEESAEVTRSTDVDHPAPITLAERPFSGEPPAAATEILSTDHTAPQPPQAATSVAPRYTIKTVQSVVHQPDKTEPPAAVTNVTTPETFPVHQPGIRSEKTSQVEEHLSVVEEQQVFLEPAPILKSQTLFQTKADPEVVERVIERSRNTDRTDFRSVTRSITNYAWREPEPTPPEPSINITIGRVEVRATPASNTKPTRTRQESPVMPLDKYLRKQRRGGER